MRVRQREGALPGPPARRKAFIGVGGTPLRRGSGVWMLAGVLALALSGCEGEESGAVSADQDEVAAVEIVSPPAGAEVEQPFELEIAVSGAEVGEIATGLDHLHVYVGDAEFDPHYSTGPYEVRDAAPGEQTIRLELARPNHDEVGVSATVTVTVAGEPDTVEEDGSRDY